MQTFGGCGWTLHQEKKYNTLYKNVIISSFFCKINHNSFRLVAGLKDIFVEKVLMLDSPKFLRLASQLTSGVQRSIPPTKSGSDLPEWMGGPIMGVLLSHPPAGRPSPLGFSVANLICERALWWLNKPPRPFPAPSPPLPSRDAAEITSRPGDPQRSCGRN